MRNVATLAFALSVLTAPAMAQDPFRHSAFILSYSTPVYAIDTCNRDYCGYADVQTEAGNLRFNSNTISGAFLMARHYQRENGLSGIDYTNLETISIESFPALVFAHQG